jgi:hypothetical protein
MGIVDGLDEGIVVGRLMEDDLAAIASIEDMIPRAGDGSSGGPGHASSLSPTFLLRNISYVPFSPASSSAILVMSPFPLCPLFPFQY